MRRFFFPTTRAKNEARALGLDVIRVHPNPGYFSAFRIYDPETTLDLYLIERRRRLSPTPVGRGLGVDKYVHRSLGRYCKPRTGL